MTALLFSGHPHVSRSFRVRDKHNNPKVPTSRDLGGHGQKPWSWVGGVWKSLELKKRCLIHL